MCNLALCKQRNRELNDSFALLYEAAQMENSFAQCFVGDCYFHGLGVEKNIEEAIKYY